MKGAPPPATPCGAQVPFRLCIRQSPGTAPVRWCGLRFALPTARLATPRLLPGACRTNRAASGRVGEPPWLSDPPVLQPPTMVMGGGGAPKRFQSHSSLASTLITRWSRRKSYIPAETAPTLSPSRVHPGSMPNPPSGFHGAS